MIRTKQDLRFYLDADKFVLKRRGMATVFSDPIWKFQVALRKSEYYGQQGRL